MATSLVSLDDKGFWCPDSLLEIFAYFLAEELARAGEPWAQEYAQHLRIQATSGLTGCIDFRLSSLSAGAQQAVSKAASEAVLQLWRNPHLLSSRSLSTLQLGGGASFQSDVDVDKIAKLDSAFQLLLSGQWLWRPNDTAALHTQWLQV